ncbi:hypothetical protein BH10PSE14_BH10PSE14_02720 [soil metagenome]
MLATSSRIGRAHLSEVEGLAGVADRHQFGGTPA